MGCASSKTVLSNGDILTVSSTSAKVRDRKIKGNFDLDELEGGDPAATGWVQVGKDELVFVEEVSVHAILDQVAYYGCRMLSPTKILIGVFRQGCLCRGNCAIGYIHGPHVRFANAKLSTSTLPYIVSTHHPII